MDVRVNHEVMEMLLNAERRKLSGVVREQTASVIELSSSSSDSDSSDSDDLDENDNANGVVSAGEGPEARASKKRKVNDVDFVLPLGFLAPLPPDDPVPAPLASDMELAEVSETVNPLEKTASRTPSSNVLSISKQFWKAGDYDGAPSSSWELSTGGMDHVRVHPKFLHSNATSHKWALGAFAELLDNSLDEVCNGATYVNVDVLKNKKDGNRMLVIEDNGGGMDPDKMRQCMSLGYSAKSKIANTIGQYGNGFKTSTMRLGADVIVFSRCCGKDGKRPTQSIGLLSYTFLTSTGKEDIVVPMLDYEWHLDEWSKLSWPTVSDWDGNVETIVQWSPFSSEVDLLRQFNLMKDHGTRIIIFNLWEDDQGLSELDFHADEYDIQLRGVNRDEKNIQMAKEFPNSRHFLTYRHSLRSYASIIYLRLPPNFRIILRGKDVEHHNIVNDMMLTEMVTYRPNPTAEAIPKDLIMAAVVTIGFVKDVKYHIDVQGFNVYHKNRLIKPFWRVWNATGSDCRGVIGILEANFVEPAHDKQGFERTTDLSRLETRLKEMQKAYWSTNCHKIGYAPQHNKKDIEQSLHRDTSPDHGPQQSTRSNKKSSGIGKKPSTDSDKLCSPSNWNKRGKESQELPKAVDSGNGNGHASGKGENRKKAAIDNSSSGKGLATSSPSTEDDSDDMCEVLPEKQANGSSQKFVAQSKAKEVKFIMPPRTRNAPPSSRKGKEVASSPRAPRRRNMQQPVPPAESSSSSSESETEPIDVSEQEEQEVNLNSMTERQQQLRMKRQDFIAKEPIPERGVLLTVGGVNRKYTDTIDALGWGAFVRAPNRYCHEFVREFYSNLHRLKRNIIMIFGRPFTLSPDVIRAYYQLPRVSVEEDLFYQLERGLTDVPSRVEMVYTLTLGREPEWYKADNFRFKCGSLCREARFWWLLTQGKIQGNRSDSDVSISVQNLLFCIVTRQRFDVGDVLYNTFVTLQKKLKKGTLLKSSVSYPCLISELCQLQGIPVPPGATYGRPKSTLKQKHAEDDPTQTESCFDWHQRYYGMRGQEGWEEPAFPFPSEPEPQHEPQGQQQHEPQPQQQHEPQPQQHPPSYGSWNTTDIHPTLQTLTSDLEALRWTTRSDIYQVRQEVGRIGRVVDQIRADQVQFLQEYRMDQVQRRAREERRDQHPFRRSSH